MISFDIIKIMLLGAEYYRNKNQLNSIIRNGILFSKSLKITNIEIKIDEYSKIRRFS